MTKKFNIDMEKSLIGTVVPVSALRSDKSIGVGEFPDLVEFAALCKKMGVSLIQILPVNDTGYDSSPYAALTAFGLHPLYLRIGDLAEFDKSSSYSADIEAIKKQFESALRFPYEEILKAKIILLRKIFTDNVKEIKESEKLKTWIDENPWVKSYAVFRQLKETNGEKSWRDWSSNRNPEAWEIDSLWARPELLEKHLFWAWLQEALDEQFSKAAMELAEQGIILEGDLPILMNEDSCDVWAHRENFHLDFSAGAPPDMYSPSGQNWGFPIYNWERQSGDDYSWWKLRLKVAEKYYHAYRIDHVLGFFRIWAIRREDISAVMGRYIPFKPITVNDFDALKFDKGRLRWITEPHIFTGELWDALKPHLSEYDLEAAVLNVFDTALERIGTEELWLFKKSIKNESDIAALAIHDVAKNFLLKEWGNRIFFEYEKDCYCPVWYYRESRAYASLSDDEKKSMELLLKKIHADSEKIWEEEGRKLLSLLTASSSMLPCAEDLGAVPDCVPKVLKELKILGLRVVRWHREWSEAGQPYVPFDNYPELSVCTPAVHDSSCLREWWDREANQQEFCDFLGIPSLPRVYNPGTARLILSRIAAAASRYKVFQIQDLMHLSNHWYAADPASERINVPGTITPFNWTYRLPATISEIMNDDELMVSVTKLQ